MGGRWRSHSGANKSHFQSAHYYFDTVHTPPQGCTVSFNGPQTKSLLERCLGWHVSCAHVEDELRRQNVSVRWEGARGVDDIDLFPLPPLSPRLSTSSFVSELLRQMNWLVVPARTRTPNRWTRRMRLLRTSFGGFWIYEGEWGRWVNRVGDTGC